MDGVQASVYMMTTVKVFELVCAVAFLSGKFVPLASVVIFPITLNILLFHTFLAPDGLFIAILYRYELHNSPIIINENILECSDAHYLVFGEI